MRSQMTIDVKGVKVDNFLDGICVCGTTIYLDYAAHADISIFV